MENFVLRPTAWPPLRMFSRNPVVRRSDRIEAIAIVLAVLVLLVGAACAGALGTVVHDARTQQYADQAHTRHAVVAIAIEDADTTIAPREIPYTVSARWHLNDTDHAAEITWDSFVKAGDPLAIWVDDDGNRTTAPSPISRAATDAMVIAIVTWLSLALAAASALDTVRTRINYTRDAQWERDIWYLVEDDGGRTNWAQ
ncbi:hypothetical protein A5707_10050 [Mycobacterium kyorinense]|uniref:Transmembrane protein n=1 Tax=Mycobacterium kyorinense TaxID=487514 RepID=A0A1A2YPU2_9MYCO|nr:hypothetical protein [Mycobacterium kyorinense]OBI40254.1 hypothetical protein A5707_10050 [Mycobacterium kyorinense]